MPYKDLIAELFCIIILLKNIFEECTQSPFLFLSCNKENYQLQMQELAPIVLFVYNRLNLTRQTVEALQKNRWASESELLIFSDGPKDKHDFEKVKSVRAFIKEINGFKSIKIVEKEHNIGLANSVIYGVTKTVNEYRKAIIVEDDILTARNFLTFMNQSLDFYEKDLRIFSVTAFNFPIKVPRNYKYDVYISPRPSSLGWGTWRNKWMKADWNNSDYETFIKNKEKVKSFNKGGDDLTGMLKSFKNGKIDSWAIRWSYTLFKYNSYCLYPKKSFLTHIGSVKSATHVKKKNRLNVKVSNDLSEIEFIDNIQTDDDVMKAFRKFFKKNIIQKIYRQLVEIIKL